MQEVQFFVARGKEDCKWGVLHREEEDRRKLGDRDEARSIRIFDELSFECEANDDKDEIPEYKRNFGVIRYMQGANVTTDLSRWATSSLRNDNVHIVDNLSNESRLFPFCFLFSAVCGADSSLPASTGW